MATYLQAVSGEEVDRLREDPEGINQLDNEPDFSTHLMATLNYFMTGSAYPSECGPLGEALTGSESVACASLEHGSFDLVPPSRAREILRALRDVDAAELERAVQRADLVALVEREELYELEVMVADHVSRDLVRDLGGLVRFYTEIVRLGRGVAIYTT